MTFFLPFEMLAERQLHRKQVAAVCRDSWNVRKLFRVGSVLLNAFCVADVDGDRTEEYLLGTSEGCFLVLKANRREPILLSQSHSTISVVLWGPRKTLVVICLEGTCTIIENFHVNPHTCLRTDLCHYMDARVATIMSNCTCGRD